MKKILALGTLYLAMTATTALALPTLQLDILGGTYVAGSDTVVSNGDSFTLYAYLIEDSGANLVGDTYFLSAALTPKTLEPGGNYGSFNLTGLGNTTVTGGGTIAVTADMVYGTPPASVLFPNLGSHNIFDTYYKEFTFTFNSANQAKAANSQDNAGDGPQTYTSGTPMYFAAFSVNTAGLKDDYEIHFDLYNEDLKTKKKGIDYGIEFAPFSHDAQSNGNPVPEPATMVLFGTGLAGLAGAARRRRATK